MERDSRKLTKLQRNDIDHLVLMAKLSRLSLGETQQLIHDKVGVMLSEDWITHIRGKFRTQCKKLLLKLQKDQYEYISHYMERIEEVYNMQDKFWEEYRRIDDPVARITSLKEIREQTVLLTDLIEHLPLIAGAKVTANDITETQGSPIVQEITAEAKPSRVY